MNLASFDPGKNCAGVSVFVAGVLAYAALIRGEGPLDVAQKAAVWFEEEAFGEPYDALITEGQQIYGGPRKNDPNSLLPLAFACGAVQALVAARSKYSILPRIWTKGTPKDIRLARAEAALSPTEAAVLAKVKCPKSLRHNTVDSIALGKWALNNWSQVCK